MATKPVASHPSFSQSRHHKPIQHTGLSQASPINTRCRSLFVQGQAQAGPLPAARQHESETAKTDRRETPNREAGSKGRPLPEEHAGPATRSPRLRHHTEQGPFRKNSRRLSPRSTQCLEIKGENKKVVKYLKPRKGRA